MSKAMVSNHVEDKLDKLLRQIDDKSRRTPGGLSEGEVLGLREELKQLKNEVQDL